MRLHMRALRGVIVLVLVLVLAACGPSADLETGAESYNRGDYATALIEFRPLAEQGDAQAQALLGTMYMNGKGVARDYAEAAKWFHLAAEQGQELAQFSLGTMYVYGLGVTLDYVQAHKWYSLAALRSSGEDRDEAASNRDDVEAKMSPAQVTEAQRLAREWKPK